MSHNQYNFYNNNTFRETKDPSEPATLANSRNAPAEKIYEMLKNRNTGEGDPNN